MTDIDEEPGYRCICGHTRLEHEMGGKLCQVYDADGVVCMCSVFAASVRPAAPIEPIQEDEPMTVHAVPRDEMDQSEPPAGAMPNGEAEPELSDEEDDSRKASVIEQIERINRNRADVLKEFAAQEASLLVGVRAELRAARHEVVRLEAAEAKILASMGSDQDAAKPVASKPHLAKTSPAKKAAATRKARAAKPAAEGTFQAKLVSWVTEHPKSTLDDIAQAFPKEKRATISSRLYLAKKAETLKTTGTRGSMKWSGA